MEKTYQGSCHCGRIRFEVVADIDHVRVCDCTVCQMRGALIHRVPERCLRLLTPLDDMTIYTWGTHTGADYFCPTCGILPFRRPSAPTKQEMRDGMAAFAGWAINTRCLEGFDTSLASVKMVHGSRI